MCHNSDETPESLDVLICVLKSFVLKVTELFVLFVFCRSQLPCCVFTPAEREELNGGTLLPPFSPPPPLCTRLPPLND